MLKGYQLNVNKYQMQLRSRSNLKLPKRFQVVLKNRLEQKKSSHK